MKHLFATTALATALALPAYATEPKPAEGNAIDKAAEATEEAVSDTAKAAENTAEDAAQAVGNAAGTVAEKTEQAIDAAGQATAEAVDDMKADSGTGMVQKPSGAPMDGYAYVEPAQVTAEELDGARVYDSKNEWIGEISEIVLSPEGEIETLVVDVGGFLGLGEKPVGLNYETFSLQREVEGEEIRASVTATYEQLKDMPEYES
ncbi:PRC-barrel domain-containing protein [Sedimentitalea sp. JM2-8]|uniref:PRC-barrel domain-containing protein n=1 Tax=Sedimentitalea xiamensis TaxID=3050037 RepID=A0ABT7FAD3_9RHOB|nr:PRC-barrel domain-containing protein [Sedimentitalea xiamensis]MDK3072068.1 PRC-barrel domain-containing protein [Sedimentitalea xiamensis]